MGGPNSIYGTVDLLILKTLNVSGPMHGLGIAEEVHRVSGEELVVDDSALYPSLHRLERQGLVEGEWKISDRGRRAKFYDLTPDGRQHLEEAMESWIRHTDAVRKVLRFAWEDLR
ncbi:PadR family transcriptional regulator [Gemmatimonadota bacterium]